MKIKSFERFAEKHTPDDLAELTPFQEFMEDLKLATGYIVFSFILSYIIWFVIGCGVYYAIFSDGINTIYLGDMMPCGLGFSVILGTINFILMYRLYRAAKRPYLKSYAGNKFISKNSTFGGAHFQTPSQIAENFHLYDKIEDTTEEILGITDDGKIACPIFPGGTNRNEVFFGASGAGKSASIVKTHIYQCLREGVSVICTDTKGDLYKETAALVKSMGYKIRVLNLKTAEFKNSDGFNPLAPIAIGGETNAEIAALISDVIIKSSADPRESGSLDYWANNAFNLLKGLIIYLCTDPAEIKAGHNNLPYVYDFITTKDVLDYKAILTTGRRPGDPIVQCYNLFARAKAEVQGQIVNDLGMRIQKFAGGYIGKVLSNNEIDLTLPMKKKCMYYVIISDTDTAMAPVASLFFSECFMLQSGYSDSLKDKSKQLPVRYILDEYANTGGINGLDVRIATIRSRKIWLTIILQDLNQLNGMYGDDKAATILNNCYITGLLATKDPATAEYFKKLLGTQTVISRNEANEEGTADIFKLRGQTRVSFSENKADLMNAEDFTNGTLGRDELIVVFSSQPPVKLKKCFAEKAGERIHPLEIKAGELGIKMANRHKPKWRKLEEQEKENSEFEEETVPQPSVIEPAAVEPEPEEIQKDHEEKKKESKDSGFALPKPEIKQTKRNMTFLNTKQYAGSVKGSGIVKEKNDSYGNDDLGLM